MTPKARKPFISVLKYGAFWLFSVINIKLFVPPNIIAAKRALKLTAAIIKAKTALFISTLCQLYLLITAPTQ